MKYLASGNDALPVLSRLLPRLIIVAGFLLSTSRGLAQIDPGGDNSGPVYAPLASWSFNDRTNWTSDNGYAPLTFTNLAFSRLGNFQSLVVATNVPAWLRYKVNETDGTTNLAVNAGTVRFWFAPNWSGTNRGGTGPGVWGRLFEAGAYTTNSSLGWWSLYVDDVGGHLYFSTQTNDLSGNYYNCLAVPISWKTNYFHFIALTYSATNTALYLDGALATNGPPLTIYPGANALTNGFFIGSDNTGSYQAQGLFNNVATYSVPLDAGTIQSIFSQEFPIYMMNPFNTAMTTLFAASSNPTFTNTYYSAISGAGNLQWVGNAPVCVDGANALQVWFTNVTATAASNGTLNVTFTVEGGRAGYAYDVFATGYLPASPVNGNWVWLGQGYHCNTYTVNINSANVFLMLGTPLDTDGDGVTDAYERLASHTDPAVAETDAYGVPYAWYVQNGLSPQSALQDPDQDALLNYQEYQFGTRPQVSEGFAVWTSLGNGSTGIP